MNWVVEEQDIFNGGKHVLPELHSETGARDTALKHGIGFSDYIYTARLATENETAQIRSLHEACRRHEEAVKRATDRYQWACDECGGCFTEAAPHIMDDGEFLCDGCLDALIERHAPDCE